MTRAFHIYFIDSHTHTHLILIVNHKLTPNRNTFFSPLLAAEHITAQPNQTESISLLGHGGGLYFSRFSTLTSPILLFQLRYFSLSLSQRPLTNTPCFLPESFPWGCRYGRFRQGISSPSSSLLQLFPLPQPLLD